MLPIARLQELVEASSRNRIQDKDQIMKPRIRYGIIDDFGEVIRWTWDKPTGRRYVTKRLPSAYEVACELGEALW